MKNDGVVTSTYAYDANGNRLSHTGSGGSSVGTYDVQDRMLTYGNSTFAYNANGDTTRKVENGQSTNYQYDLFGNLRTVTLPNAGGVIEYVIDGKNRRIGKKINNVLVQGFLYEDQLKPAAELDGAGNIVSQFIYATKTNVPDFMRKDGVNYKIVSDQLGSPLVVINTSTNEIVQRMDYDEFGNVLEDTNPGFQPFGFAGGLYDRDTKLVRFGARDYDSESGRWMQKDPIRFDAKDTNLYGYIFSDPINKIDPSGLYQSPTGPDGGNAPVGPGTCDSFYSGKCSNDPGKYYCEIAPQLCKNLFPVIPDSDPSNCMRACLQRKEVGAPKNGSSCDFVSHEVDIHVECAQACAGTI